MWQWTSGAELYHYGIKGQRWGVRRFQNEDGTLTPAGKERYDDDGERPKTKEEKRQARIDKQEKKQALEEEKKRNSGLNPLRLSQSHRLNLEAKFREKGLSEEEAKNAAKKRIQAEIFVAAAATMTVAAAIAYKKRKHDNSDRVLDEGIEFKRIVKIANGASPDTNHRMYVSYNKSDNEKYKTSYAGQIAANLKKVPGGSEYGIYQLGMKANGPVKVASRNRAAKVFTDLFENDPEFRDVAQKTFLTNKYSFTKFNVKANANALTTKDLMGKGYDAFNRGLTGNAPTPRYAEQRNKFYEALKKQGYNAIEDMNDKKYSGYKAKDPIITLDGMRLISKTKLDEKEIAERLENEAIKTIGKGFVRNGAIYVTAKGLTAYNVKAEDRELIRQYKELHPNTEMSDKAILETIKPYRK